MSNLSIEDLRELIRKGESRDPLVFLECVMNGQDPRKLSSIYKLILEIDDFSGGDVSPSDWSEIVDHVISRFKYSKVSMSESMNASKTLAEYVHAKRKHIEITGNRDSTNSSHEDPLTEEEIYLFREKFNDEY